MVAVAVVVALAAAAAGVITLRVITSKTVIISD